MPQRTRNIEVSFAREAQPGVAETLTSADVGLVVSDASVTYSQGEVERQPAGGTFSRRPPFAGLQTASVSFSFQLAGPRTGSISTAPAWGLLLEAAGFRQIAVKKIQLANSVAVFSSGNVLKNLRTFTANTTGATGRIIGSVWKGSGITTVIYEPLTGTLDATDTSITVNDTDNRFDATVTLSSQTPADAGTAWVPVSKEILAISAGAVGGLGDGNIDADDLLRGQLSGSTLQVIEDYDGSTLKYRACHRDPINGETLTSLNDGDTITTSSAPSQFQYPSITVGVNEDGLLKIVAGAIVETLELEMAVGAAPICRVTLQGTAETPIDQAPFLTGVDPLQTSPRFLNANLVAADYASDNWALANPWDPALSTMTLQVATSPAQRTDATTPTGLKQYLGSDKVISGTMDPEQLNEAVFAHYEAAANKEPFRFLASWGLTGQTPPNAFVMAADEMMFNTLNSADRNGVRVLDGQFTLYGTNEDEFALLLLS